MDGLPLPAAPNDRVKEVLPNRHKIQRAMLFRRGHEKSPELTGLFLDDATGIRTSPGAR
jgi:hypothetical protein